MAGIKRELYLETMPRVGRAFHGVKALECSSCRLSGGICDIAEALQALSVSMAPVQLLLHVRWLCMALTCKR